MMAGDLDAYPAFPAPEALDQFKSDPALHRRMSAPPRARLILALNNAKKPFDDIRVRRALAYCDRPQGAASTACSSGYGVPIGSHYVPQDPGYIDLTGAYPFDPAKAKALLAEAGIKPGFSMTISLPPPRLCAARRRGDRGDAPAGRHQREAGADRVGAMARPGVLRGRISTRRSSRIPRRATSISMRATNTTSTTTAPSTRRSTRNTWPRSTRSSSSISLGQLQKKLAEDEPNVFTARAAARSACGTRSCAGCGTTTRSAANDVSWRVTWSDAAARDRRGQRPFVDACCPDARSPPRSSCSWCCRCCPAIRPRSCWAPSARPDTLAALHHQLGLDRPLLAALRRLDRAACCAAISASSYTYSVPVARADRPARAGQPAAGAAWRSCFPPRIAIPTGVFGRGAARARGRCRGDGRRADRRGGAEFLARPAAHPAVRGAARLVPGERLRRLGSRRLARPCARCCCPRSRWRCRRRRSWRG